MLDDYSSGSLKQSAQKTRGTGIHKKVVAHSKLPKLAKLSQNKRKKVELFEYVSSEICKIIGAGPDGSFVSTQALVTWGYQV